MFQRRPCLDRFLPLAVLACAPALASAGGRPAGQELAELVAPDAVVYAQVPSLDRIEEVALALTRAFAPGSEQAVDVDQMIGSMGLPIDPSQIDHARPIGISLSLVPGEDEPSFRLIVPATEPGAFADMAAMMGMQASESHGGWIALSMSPGAIAPGAPSRLATELPAGDVVVRVDVRALIERYRSEIDAGLEEIVSETTAAAGEMPGGMNMGPLMQVYVGALRTFLESVADVDLAFRLDGGRLEFLQECRMREGSLLADFGSKAPTNVAEVASLVDAGSAMSMAAGMDPVALMQRFRPMMDALPEVYPEPLRPTMRALMGDTQSLAMLIGTGFAGSGGFGPKGMQFVSYLRPTDAQKLIATYGTMLRAVPNAGIEGPLAVDVAGISATRFRMRFDLDALAGTAGAPEEERAKVRETMTALYGEGMQLTLAAQGNRMAIVLGEDPAFVEGAVRGLNGRGSGSPALQRALSRVTGMNPCFAYEYDVGETMAGMKTMLAAMMPEETQELPELDLSVAAWFGVDGLRWHSGGSLELEELAKVVRQMTAMTMGTGAVEGTKARADVIAIRMALDEYAANNGMRYPESLEVLVTPDANGQRYLEREELPLDPWGRAYRYEPPTEAQPRPRVYTLGRDGEPGGEDEDADVDSATMDD